MAIWHWFLHVTGISNVSGSWYGFWSGFASDIPEFAILAIIYRKLNCHADGCKRIGLHHVKGTNFITCRKHHPTHGNSVEQIHTAHAEAQAKIAREAA